MSPKSRAYLRRSIRLKGYDYGQAGAYFVTITSHDRKCLFGEVVGTHMRLNTWGRIVKQEWFKTADIRPRVHLVEEDFVAMPNHVHGIIWISEADVGAQRRCAPTMSSPRPRVVPESLGAVVRAYKSATTHQINELRATPRRPVWQRNYYEHVIRDEEELSRIRRYVLNNPLQWELDRENPNAVRRVSGLSTAEPWRG